jgi:hypothetical protein
VRRLGPVGCANRAVAVGLLMNALSLILLGPHIASYFGILYAIEVSVTIVDLMIANYRWPSQLRFRIDVHCKYFVPNQCVYLPPASKLPNGGSSRLLITVYYASVCAAKNPYGFCFSILVVCTYGPSKDINDVTTGLSA